MLQPSENSSLTVRRLLPHDRETADRWDAFVQDSPDATFFHRAGWQKVVMDVFRHDTYFLYAEQDGVIRGVLPLGHVKSWLFGNSLVGLPFAVYGGVVANSSQAGDALEHEAQQLAQQLDVAHLEWRNRTPRHTDWPQQNLYVTFRKKILSDQDANMRAIPRKQRAMVRKGIQHGLMSEIDRNEDRFYDLYADNVLRHGTPALPKRYFTALLAEFGRDCEVMTIVTPQGQPVSSVLSFYFRDEVLPYYAGDDKCARDLAANDFKYWELMRRASARGVQIFDYGRSKRGTGSYAFKRNWGFEPTPLHYEYCLYKRDAIPQNNPSNGKFKWMIAAWRRMPLSMANWLGPLVVRNLG